MMRKRQIGAILVKSTLVLLLFGAPLPASALHYLPEGCFGQLTGDQVVVYYFTRKFRCQSCETLEHTMLQTVRERYSLPFSSGKLAMCVINVDDPVNRHFLDEFEILSTSVYIVEKREGEIVRSLELEGMWEVLDDAQAISSLLMEGLAQYMDGSGPGPYLEDREDTGVDGKSADNGDKSDDRKEGSKPKHRVSDPESRDSGPGSRD